MLQDIPAPYSQGLAKTYREGTRGDDTPLGSGQFPCRTQDLFSTPPTTTPTPGSGNFDFIKISVF